MDIITIIQEWQGLIAFVLLAIGNFWGFFKLFTDNEIKFAELEEKINTRFAEFEGKMNTRFAKIESDISYLKEQNIDTKERLNRIEKEITEIRVSLGKLETRFDELDNRVLRLEQGAHIPTAKAS